MSDFSIIVPVCNMEMLLRETIDSILCQTYPNFELLIIDDGSTDGSAAICDEYAENDARVRVFHKRNGGVSSARNLGIEYMGGKWLLFVDADDVISPSLLMRCKQLLDDNDPDVLQIGMAESKNWENGGESAVMGLEEYVSHRDICYRLSVIFKTEIIRKHNLCFDESLHLAEDTLFLFSYFSISCRFQKLYSKLYYYRANPQGASHNQKTQDMLDSCRKEIEFKHNNPLFSHHIDSSLLHYLVRIIYNDDCSLEKLHASFKDGLPFDKRAMFPVHKCFAFALQLSFILAVKSIKLYFLLKKAHTHKQGL